MGRNQETLFFLHIPKAAGSTLNYLLEKQFPPEATYATSMTWHHPDGSLDGFDALPVEKKEKLSLVNGHMGFGLHSSLPQPAKYITILREPIARTISHFRFESQLPDSPLYPIIQSGKMGLQEYIHYYNHYECDNLQTRMITGNWNKRGYGPCSSAMLETAKHNLKTHFALVGITDFFDEFYLLLRRKYGWRPAFTRKLNVARKRPKAVEFTAEEQYLLKQHNFFDMQLYQFAQALFAEKLQQQQGLSFSMELAAYRLARRSLAMYWEARTYSVRVFIRERLSALTQ